jgi:hypothetical protein
MLQGDLDRLGDDVGAVGAAAEVLRTLIDGWDEGHGKPEAHGLMLDRALGLDATFVHPASFPEAFASGSEAASAYCASGREQAWRCFSRRDYDGARVAAGEASHF